MILNTKMKVNKITTWFVHLVFGKNNHDYITVYYLFHLGYKKFAQMIYCVAVKYTKNGL